MVTAPRVDPLHKRTATTRTEREAEMSVAKVSELSVTSSKSFQDAIEKGLERANQTLRNVRSAWIKEQQIRVKQGKITEFQVNMLVTFVIDD
jgi:flavin-binding protein dodecin